MNLVAKLILTGLACYAVGTIVGPIAVGTVQESREALSPFMFISAAVLIASIGYAVGAIRRSPFGGGRDPREDGYYR
jgi:hypothetical protein